MLELLKVLVLLRCVVERSPMPPHPESQEVTPDGDEGAEDKCQSDEEDASPDILTGVARRPGHGVERCGC